VMCKSSLCAKHKSDWQVFSSYDLSTLSKITQIKKVTSDIKAHNGSRILMHRN
jgi:hypothetical protein